MVATDGELLDSVDVHVLVYDEELSYHPRPDLSHARYYEVTVFHIKPGHMAEWLEMVKMYKGACEKTKPDAHWAAYDVRYGAGGGTFVALTHLDSLAEVDKMVQWDDKFVENIGGEDAVKKWEELSRDAIDSSQSELFSINPKQSYPEESWIKGDPDFWKPKKTAPEAASAKPAAKPTGN